MKKLLFLLSAAAVIVVLFCSCSSMEKPPIEGSYYVHAEGNDRNNGLSEEYPFRSLFKAMVMAVDSRIKTITVIGTLNAESEQSINTERVFFIQGMGTTPILIRGKISDTNPAVLSAAGTGRRVVLIRGTVPIRFENIEISGGFSSNEIGGLGIGPGSTVTLGPVTVIRDNQSNFLGGGVFVAPGGSLFVDGAKIFDNRSDAPGGGIAVAGQTSVLVIRNGEIYNNHAQAGGGIALYQGSSFTLSGGVIHSNTADLAGGGVILNQDCIFTMEGGEIRGNRSSGSGGGIALMERSSFILLNGEILENRAAEHGGGIASDHTGIITIQGGFISSNRAASSGGGVFTSGAFFKSAGRIYGRDMPQDAANAANSGAAIFVYHMDGTRTREISAGDNLVLDASVDDGWIITNE